MLTYQCLACLLYSQAETEALLELVGASGYPRQLQYARGLNADLDAFCQAGTPACSPT